MLNRLREWWERLGRNNQIIIAASAFGVLVALIGFVSWANTPEYVPLFSNLSAQDANAITDKLRESNVPYRLTQSGTALEVPAAKRDEMRMKILSAGLPREDSAKISADPVASTNPFMTRAQEEAALKQSQEASVSRTIMQMEPIASATVHFAPGNGSAFATDNVPPSASVLVTLKAGQTLSKENVQAIVRLTQMSFTGLTDQRITVVNSQGDLLYNPDKAGQADMGDRMEQERAIAQEYRQRIQNHFDSSLGPNKVIVSVSAEINHDREESVENVVEPGVVIEDEKQSEQMEGTPPAGRAPGTNANVTPPGIPQYDAAGGGNTGQFKSETSKKKVQPTTKEIRTIKTPGSIKKLTVSALVDAKIPVELLTSIKDNIQTLIGMSGGSDPTRMVSVAQVPFDRTEQEAAEKAAAAARSAESTARLVSILVPLALIFLCFWLLSRALRRPQPILGEQLALQGAGGGTLALDEAEPMMVGPDGTPMVMTADGQIVEGALNTPVIGIPTGDTAPKTFEMIEEAFDANLESILHLSKSKPETVAALIKSWIAEES